MRKCIGALLALGFGVCTATAYGMSPPQGFQSNAAFARSYAAHNVTAAVATAQRVSCYSPEIEVVVGLTAANGYPDGGGTACPGATTGESLGPYSTQDDANPALLVKDHSESDIHVDPTNPQHLIGVSKWFVNSEGYNHLTGFFESFDGGQTWPQQGHIPGYEGWTDNSDPVGAFDPWGNFYAVLLPYMFEYDARGQHDVGNAAVNPARPRFAIGVAVRRRDAAAPTDWSTARDGHPDFVATTPFERERSFDKQWVAIDTNRRSPHFGRVYVMWAVADAPEDARLKVVVSYADAHPDGTHTPWSTPRLLPGVLPGLEENNALPHVAPDGTVWTTVSAVPPGREDAADNRGATSFAARVSLLSSRDGGVTWRRRLAIPHQVLPIYSNTTFRSGFGISSAVGTRKLRGVYPVYIAYEQDTRAGSSVHLAASFDSGARWRTVRVNDNAGPGEAIQPSVSVAPDGTVVVAFYDRRLPCPQQGTPAATAAGLAFDPLTPYGRTNYCVDTAAQLYRPNLKPLGHNIRLSPHAWDPQLSAPRYLCICNLLSFIGDYFGLDTRDGFAYTSSVTTYNENGENALFHQQQLVSKLKIP